MDSKSYNDSSRPKTPSRPEVDIKLPINPRRKFRRRGTGDHSNHDSDSEDEDKSIMTDSSDHELDDFGSDDDIESGLPTEERRKFLRKQRKQNNLDSRIAGVAGRLSEQEKKEADKTVLQKVIQNAALICLWYFFSLSISLVRTPRLRPNYTNALLSTTSGCSRPTTSTSISPSSLPPSTWSSNSSSHPPSSSSSPPSDQRSSDQIHESETADRPNHSSHLCST